MKKIKTMKMMRDQKTDGLSCFQKRREKIYDWMALEGVSLLMLEDAEGRRDPSLQWLSGMPSDALLFLSADREAVLVAWDINLAAAYADADLFIPYSEFQRKPLGALQGAVKLLKIAPGSKLEIPPITPYPVFLDYVGALTDHHVLCRREGAWEELEQLRAVKDEGEIAIYRKVSAITNELITLIEKQVRSGKIKTESDAALLIEAECRKQGCEGTGFGTLAAGPDRSWGIHAFPPYTSAPFGGQGLSILDFGLKYSGYTTDVTLTFVRDPSGDQERMAGLVEKAYKLALSMVKVGESTRAIAAAVDACFAKSRMFMPHGLGHGVGLEDHEKPDIRNRDDNNWVLTPGMIFTLEPGLYDPALGGCRLENDILLTEGGAELLTNARIIRL